MPWAAIVSVLLAIIGFIIWLVRLEGRANSTARDVARVEAKADSTDRDVRDLQVKSITRDDLREVKQELTERIDAVGKQMSDQIASLIAAIARQPPKSGS